MNNEIHLTTREKVCPICGGWMEVVEISEELWVLDGREIPMVIFLLRCLQCYKQYTIRKSKEEGSIINSKNWEV